MYTNLTTTPTFPKTLVIRNESGGMIWQIYHVNNEQEVEILSSNATHNGFFGITLEDYDETAEETWPEWRDTPQWEKQLEKFSL